MKKIISINKKRFSNNFFYVNYEDNSFDVCYIDVINKYNFTKDLVISDSNYLQIKSEIDYFYFKDKALAYLSNGLKTEIEVIRKLKKLDAKQTTIEQIIKNLKEFAYLNDKLVAERFVSYYQKKNKSNTYISQKLFSKGISKEIIKFYLNESIRENPEVEIEVILKLIEKKKGKLESYSNFQDKKKYLFQHLSLKGFKFYDIAKSIDIFFKSIDNDEM